MVGVVCRVRSSGVREAITMDPASLALAGLPGPGVFLNTGPKNDWEVVGVGHLLVYFCGC
jgi:hypothetical protein